MLTSVASMTADHQPPVIIVAGSAVKLTGPVTPSSQPLTHDELVTASGVRPEIPDRVLRYSLTCVL